MSLSPTTPNLGSSLKSFWDKQEGTTAKWFLGIMTVAGVGAALFFLGPIVAFLAALMGNVLLLGIYCGAIFLGGCLLMNKTVQNLFKNVFMSCMRALTNIYANTDPIGVLDNNIKMIQDEGVKFDTGVKELAASKAGLDTDQLNYQEQIRKEMALAQECKKRATDNLALQATLKDPNAQREARLEFQRLKGNYEGHGSTAGLAKAAYEGNIPRVQQTDEFYESLCRARDLAVYKVKFLKMQRDIQANARKRNQASNKALTAAGRMLKGNPEQNALVDQALQALADDSAATLGAMRDFNRWTANDLMDMDIEKSAAARRMFGELESTLSLTPGSDDNTIPDLPLLSANKGSDGVYAVVKSNTANDDDPFK